MEDATPTKKGLLRRALGVLLVIVGLVIFLAPTTILIWGAVENWSNPCEERIVRSRQGTSANSTNIDKDKLYADARDSCRAIREKDLPMLLAFGVIGFSGLILAFSGAFLYRGRRKS